MCSTASLRDERDLEALHGDVHLHRLVHLVERVLVRQQVGDGQAPLLSLLEEVEALHPVLGLVSPAADGLDLLVAHVEVRAVRGVAVVGEEPEFAETAAAADVLPRARGGLGRARALEHHLGALAARDLLHLLHGVGVHAVDRIARAEALGELQAPRVAVARDDVPHAQAAHHRQQQQSDRTAALHKHVAVELEVEDQLGLLHGVDDHGRRLDEDPEVAVHVGDVEHDATGVDLHVLAEPAVEAVVHAGQEAEDLAAVAELLDLGVVLARVAGAAGLEASDDLVADLERLAREVLRHVLAELDDLARALMAELDGAEPEGVALVLVHVGAADAAPLHLHQDLVVTDLRDRKFVNDHLARGFQHGNLRRLRNVCHFLVTSNCHGPAFPGVCK